MKKYIPLLYLLLCNVSAFAQFKLNGKITNYSGKEKLIINIPQVYGFYRENSITIPVSKNGTFSITLPVKAQKFANLIFTNEFHTLLLSANKNLTVRLNEHNKKIDILSGSALPECKLLESINLEENLFFMQDNGDNPFGKLGLSEIKTQVIKPCFAIRDKKINMINQSAISLKNKRLISSEVKYMAYNNLDVFASQIKSRSTTDSMMIDIFDNIDIKPEVFPAGPQYYAFARNYLSYMETKAFIRIKKENIKPNQPIPYYGISLDSANIVVKNYGKPYWRWIGSTKNFPDVITEQLTYQQILSLVNDKDLRQTEALAKAFINRFPSSPYNSNVRKKLTSLKTLLLQNEVNASIKIFDNYKTTNSIYEVIKSFKGKVVYVDVWGTWCGPCKEELKFIPQLKSAFKDKDVAFVYLDMDEDDRDAIWKEFIKVNSLSGTHLRKNRQAIDAFWKELLVNSADKTPSYPQYFIFDKEGKLTTEKASHPSRTKDLYKQIDLVLNRK
jgi:thiol-disulfide isomerase/thioredoxin